MLTWNLFHGRCVPAAGHPLKREFAAALAGWDWDVALLQEVPSWWPEARCASQREATQLRRRPERRVVHAVRLAGGQWVGNLHAHRPRSGRRRG